MMRDWLQLSRPPSQLYILIPLFFGWFLAGAGSTVSLSQLMLFGFCFHFVTVCVNDLVDVEADTINPHPTCFSGGSRVLVERKLTKKSIYIAVLVMFFLSMWTANAVGHSVVVLAVVGYVLLALYCLKPFQMSYRGYGEWLQALGMGGVLPIIGWSFLKDWRLFHGEWLSVLLPLHYSLACVTTLPDVEGDTVADKNAIAVRLGPKKTVFRLCMVAIAAWCVALWFGFLEGRSCLFLSLCTLFSSVGLLSSTANIKQQLSIGLFISLVLGMHGVWIYFFFVL
ncbi:MAG: prenyltransferase [Oligoflexales bacterium]